MKIFGSLSPVSCCLLILLCPGSGECLAQSSDDFRPLFNGKDLEGWYAMKTMDPREFNSLSDEEQDQLIQRAKAETGQHWRVENGEIVNDGTGPYLTTENSYGDFELMIEYKTVPRADSGIYLKATPQVQIWDYTDPAKFNIGADKGSGGLWNNKHAHGKDPLVKADQPFGQWNQFRILQVGARTSVLAQWQTGRGSCDHGQLLGKQQTSANLPRGRFNCRPTVEKSAGATSRYGNSTATKPTMSWHPGTETDSSRYLTESHLKDGWEQLKTMKSLMEPSSAKLGKGATC